MQISWFKAHSYKNNMVRLDVTKTFRFKRSFIEEREFTEKTSFLIGCDEDEIPMKFLYFLPINIPNEEAFKLTYRKSGWSVSGKGIVNKLNLKVPINLKIEDYYFNNDTNKEKIRGFRLLLKEETNNKILKDSLSVLEKKEELPSLPSPIIKTNKKRNYKPKKCSCGNIFTPKSSREIKCEDCQKAKSSNLLIEGIKEPTLTFPLKHREPSCDICEFHKQCLDTNPKCYVDSYKYFKIDLTKI